MCMQASKAAFSVKKMGEQGDLMKGGHFEN